MNQWKNLTNLFSDRLAARNQKEIDTSVRALGFLGLGAGLMYFLDPDRGRRRRALARDQVAHTTNILSCATNTTARDLGHRLRGIVAEGRQLFSRKTVEDESLLARVRSNLGRVSSHPHAITVNVDGGHVSLSGHILEREMRGLLKRINKIPGVRTLKHGLIAHKEAGDVPGLQGGRPRSGNRGAFLRTNWAPAPRFLACIAGGALMGYCLKRRNPLAISLGTLGFGLFTRGITNLAAKRLIGVGAGDCAVEAHKAININAPVARVYEFFTNCQNFPRFMTNVREVQRTGNDSRWTVSGPMGMPVQWAARITENIPNQRISWETVPGSLVRNSGMIQFRPNKTGGTQVDIRLLYNPIVGAMGHALAKFFGADPKSEMDADLLRMKTMIETGHAPHDAANPIPHYAGIIQQRSSASSIGGSIGGSTGGSSQVLH
jgi:uncharacterized membrane protein